MLTSVRDGARQDHKYQLLEILFPDSRSVPEAMTKKKKWKLQRSDQDHQHASLAGPVVRSHSIYGDSWKLEWDALDRHNQYLASMMTGRSGQDWRAWGLLNILLQMLVNAVRIGDRPPVTLLQITFHPSNQPFRAH